MNVDKEVARVFTGFLSLSQDKKMAFYGMIRDYQSGNDHTIRELKESVTASITKMQTGPYGETCGCCGR